MPYLIDGNNLIGFVSSFSQNDPRSRLDLLGQLWLFQRITRTRLSVVFDGPSDPELVDECRFWPKFQLHFARPGEKADEIILSLIQRSNQPGAIILVTSDRELRAMGRLRGVKLLTSAEFARRLKKILKEKKKAKELHKPRFSSSPLEIKIWLEMLTRK